MSVILIQYPMYTMPPSLPLPENTAILYEGSVAPGFSQLTTLDNLFVKGTTSSTSTTGGTSTHSHTVTITSSTSGAHNNHVNNKGSISNCSDDTIVWDAHEGTVDVADMTHSHSSGTMSHGSYGNHTHVGNPTNSASDTPSYKGLYWCYNGANIPDNAILMWYNASTPFTESGGWTIYNMSGSYVMGNTSSVGGANTHTHNVSDSQSGGSHTHSINRTSGGPDASSQNHPTSGTSVATAGHTHSGAHTSASDGSHTHTITTTDAQTNEPAYITMYFIKKESSASAYLSGTVLLYHGTEVSAPAGWSWFTTIDGRFIKGIISGICSTGGGTSHSHSTPTNTDANAWSHSHSYTAFDSGGPSSTAAVMLGAELIGIATTSHNHSFGSSSLGAAGTSHSHAITGIASANHEPLYRTYRFIIKD